jgi:hypothetical protein
MPAAPNTPKLAAGHFLFTSESVGEGHPGTLIFFALSRCPG